MASGRLDDKLDSVFQDSPTGYQSETAVNAGRFAGEASYEKIHFVVHPGWAAKNYGKDWENHERKDIFLQEFYSEYMDELGDVMRAEDEAVHVIYSEGGKSHAETIIEQLGGEAIQYTESFEDSGKIPDPDLQEVIETVEELSPSGGITVHGEINGRCHSVFQEQLDENTEPDTDINEGVTFPPKATWNYAFQK